MHVQLVGFQPVPQRFDAHAVVPQVGGFVHQKAVAGGRAQRIHHVDLPLREALAEDAGGVAGGVHRAAEAAGQADVQHVLARLQEGGEVLHIFGHVHLTGAGVGTFRHAAVELVKRDGYAQIVGVVHAVQHEVEADIVNLPGIEMLLGQVCRGAAAENVVCHEKGHSFSLPAIGLVASS